LKVPAIPVGTFFLNLYFRRLIESAMFTGIIETTGRLVDITRDKTNVILSVESSIGPELRVDQSVSHNGVCLTVTGVENRVHKVTAVDETLTRSALGALQPGDIVNLERCMLNNGRFDGHIVQGHVDQKGLCRSVVDQDGSWLFDFEYDPSLGNLTVEKGSICINGVSLTCFNCKENGFTVAIIPYTFHHTNFQQIKAGDSVNLEFDIIGKYVQKLLATSGAR